MRCPYCRHPDSRVVDSREADDGALIPDRDDASGTPVGYWPMSLGTVHRPGYDLVAVATQRVRSSGEGPFDFENLGPSVAVFVVPRGGTPQLKVESAIRMLQRYHNTRTEEARSRKEANKEHSG